MRAYNVVLLILAAFAAGPWAVLASPLSYVVAFSIVTSSTELLLPSVRNDPAAAPGLNERVRGGRQ